MTTPDPIPPPAAAVQEEIAAEPDVQEIRTAIWNIVDMIEIESPADARAEFLAIIDLCNQGIAAIALCRDAGDLADPAPVRTMAEGGERGHVCPFQSFMCGQHGDRCALCSEVQP